MKKEDNILDQIGNKNPFSIPENYFENFNQKMIEKISEQKTVKTIGFYKKISPYLYLAAMFAVILFIGNLLLTKSATEKKQISEEKTKQTTKDERLLTYIDDNTLIEYLVDNDDTN